MNNLNAKNIEKDVPVSPGQRWHFLLSAVCIRQGTSETIRPFCIKGTHFFPRWF